MVPFESLGFLSTFRMALYCIISEIKRYIGRKSQFFHTLAFDSPGPRRNIAISFGIEKLERPVTTG